jgi:uncharacterized membrane protein YdjX (TVP38/TMEM64 family)
MEGSLFYRNRIAIGLLLLSLIIVLWWFMPMNEWIRAFGGWIESMGYPGVVAFILLYVLFIVIVGPSSALALTAGLAYGAFGFPLVVFSATLGCTVAFFIGRYVARQRVISYFEQDLRFRALDQAMSSEGWRVVGLMRLSPMLPYGIQSYLLAVTRIQLLPFVMATAVGIMPASALVVYIGSLGRKSAQAGLLGWLLLLAGLCATVLVVWLITKRARVVLDAIQEEDMAER